ncbi:HAMP domain-containing sensor histidine kinase [Rudanella lutea]|uniref:HAMP domain-containing sensor histidine kinase n=1 Tax=Rudanella lutea TaxID=451374 RepID=UPI000376C937|nr:HAMP domain-containing sensor histidine kinase [Rudanella lutea]
MTLRAQIALRFSLIVAAILLLLFSLIYVTASTYRRDDFYDRLKQKARTTVRFLVHVKEVDRAMLKIIDRNSLTALFDEKVLVFDHANKLIYSSVDDAEIDHPPALLNRIRQEGELEVQMGQYEMVGIASTQKQQQLVVLASALDAPGLTELRHLRNTLFWGFIGGVGLTILAGIFFAGQSLRPLNEFNQQIKSITARNLRQRLDEGNQRDELEQLAMNFNALLARLDEAFAQQRAFVSHASHELRTPLTALKSEIQLALRQPLDRAEHERVLHTMLLDTDRLIGLANSLLFLARSLEDVIQMPLEPVRIDDAVFEARDELLSSHPDYRVDIQYGQAPEIDDETLVEGNATLLRRVLLNLFDNACKYSPDHTARVCITIDNQQCHVIVEDKGIGIPAGEQAAVFEPFRRASNVHEYEGFGLGLPICQRIAELHRGKITLESKPNEGSTFRLSLPHL